MSRLWRSIVASRPNHAGKEEYDSLGGPEEQEERGAINGALEAAENHLLKRSLERMVIFLQISVSLLSLLPFRSILCQGNLQSFKASTSRLIPSPISICAPKIYRVRQNSTVSAKARIPTDTPEQSPRTRSRSSRATSAAGGPTQTQTPPGTPSSPQPRLHLHPQLQRVLPSRPAKPPHTAPSTPSPFSASCTVSGQLWRFTWMFLDAIVKANGTRGEEMRAAIVKMFVQGDAEEHLRHCFDHLRQGVMCNADVAVEWPRTKEDGRRFAVDGWGVPHECKN